MDTTRHPQHSRPGRERTARSRGEELEPAVIALLVFYGLAILCANVALVAGF
ncbi:hypothetical protein [Lentisalinibacter sediminis]|uniref:hypothetical protein n=1 Tax=Lentisalinibacter sediminis TaxID=2992237 RepID=UPI003867ECAA